MEQFIYHSLLGDIEIIVENETIYSLQFIYDSIPVYEKSVKSPSTLQAKLTKYLDAYFSSSVLPPFDFSLTKRASNYRNAVFNSLKEVESGTTISYKQLALNVEKATGKKTSPRAVASALAANKILILYPCHRIVHTDGRLGGYRGGVERKRALLELEKRSKV